MLTMLDLFSILSFSLSVVSSLNLVGKRNGVKGGEEKRQRVKRRNFFLYLYLFLFMCMSLSLPTDSLG